MERWKTVPGLSQYGNGCRTENYVDVTARSFPESLFANGFTDLVSVIPPGAKLTPSSKIPQAQVGKVPGKRLPNGLFVGYDWRKAVTTADDVRAWIQIGRASCREEGRSRWSPY